MEEKELEVFAVRLKELRTELHLTQKEFAENIGVTAAALSSYENGQINPSIGVAKKIAQTFNVSVDWLCGLSDQKKLGNSITTYGEMLQLAYNLTEVDMFGGSWSVKCIEDTSLAETGGPVITEPALVCNSSVDSDMQLFFSEWQQMQALYKACTIDHHLYELWITDRLKHFTAVPLIPSIK